MKFLFFLLVVAALISGYFYYQKNTLEREEAFWGKQFKDHLTVLIRPSAEGIEPDEATFFKFLLVLHKTEHAKMDMSKIFTDACLQLGVSSEAAAQYWENVNADLTTANNLKIFDDPDNLINLERGESPVIQNADWKGEKMGLVQIIPPLLAPEVSKNLANLALVPEFVRNATPQIVTPAVVEHTFQLVSHGLLSRETQQRITSAKMAEKY